ncbi:putative mitochondrial protein [Tanacetum coccineum]
MLSLLNPLTALFKKNSFNWNNQATESFNALQQAMVQSLVLALPNFEKEFVIETDALGYGVGARITTPFQSKWLPKLLEFDYKIEYKKGKENMVAMKAVKATWFSDPILQSVITSLKKGTYKNSKYTWSVNELRRKGKLVVGSDEQLRLKLISYFHSSPTGGHSGV